MNETARKSLIGEIDREIASLYPGSFAMVMATGIIATAAHLLSLAAIAETLFVINLFAYGVLWILFVARIIRHPARLVDDFKNFGKSAGFFTVVAGTCVLGNQFVLQKGWLQAAWVLWGLGLGLWVILIYLFFYTLITGENKPALENGINGAWLIAVVATQSISVLGSLLAPAVPQSLELVLYFALLMYLLGCMLYLLLFILIFYRLLYFRLPPETFSPTYWIMMGAIAITTLAGDRLMMNAHLWSFIATLMPFIQGLTLFFWAFATWLIPLLVILGVWRHSVKRVPLQYDPQYWGLVFPLGMYTVSTFLLAKAAHLDFLAIIPQGFVYIALAAWLATLGGLAIHLLRALWPGHNQRFTADLSKKESKL